MTLGLAYMDGKVVVVAKAEVEFDHGKPFYLCQTQIGKQAFQPVETREEAIAWMTNEGAESFFDGEPI